MSGETPAPNHLMQFKAAAIHQDSTLSPIARLTGLLLTDHMFDGPTAFPSLPKLAALAGSTEATISKAIRELEKAGLVSVTPGSRKGERRSSTYRFLKADPRKVCRGGARCVCSRPPQKKKAARGRPWQKRNATPAKFAAETLMKLSTDETLGTPAKFAGEEQPSLQPVDLAAYVRKVADSNRLPAIPGSRCA